MERAPDFRPLYAQVRDLVLGRLASGEWRPGDLLPSEPRLAEEFGVSQGTVRKALDELSGQNILVRHQGKGTYVATHTPDRALFHFFHLASEDGARVLPESRVISRREGRATRREQEALALDGPAGVIRIVRVRRLGGTPVLAERITVSAERFPGLRAHASDALPNTFYALYEQDYGVAIADAVERLRAVAAEEFEARLLGVEIGAPVLEIERVARTIGEQPVEWRISRCDTSRHHYLSYST